MLRGLFFSSLILFFGLGALYGKQPLQRVTIESRYKPASIGVGGIMRMELVFRFPAGYSLTGIATNRSAADYTLKLDKKPEVRSVGNDRLLVLRGMLQSFEIRDFFFSGFVLLFKDPTGKKYKQRFGMSVVHVVPPVINMKKQPPIRDIYGPLAFEDAFPWLLLVPILLLLVALAYYWGKRRGAQKSDSSQIKKGEDPWEFVQRRLAKIETLYPKDPAEAKQFYFLLTETVKTYLSLRSGLPVLEATTAEMGQFLEEIDWCSLDERHGIHELFKEADLVKFAKYLPSQEEVATYFSFVRNWLQSVEASYHKFKTTQAEEVADGL